MSDILSDLPATTPPEPVMPEGEISSIHPGENPDEISTECPGENVHEISEKSFFEGECLRPDRSLLIRIDPLLMDAIDAERALARNKRGKLPPRTKVMRALMHEGLDARLSLRGDIAPSAVAMEGAGPSGSAVK